MPSISAIGHLFFARFPPKQITGDIPWIFAGNADPKTTLKNIDGRGGNRGGDGCYLRINYSNTVMGSYDHMIMIMGSLRIALKILSLSLSVNLPFWFLFDQLTHDQGYMTGWKSPTARPMKLNGETCASNPRPLYRGGDNPLDPHSTIPRNLASILKS